MLGAEASGGNVRFEVIFPFDGRAGETAQHGDLPDVRQCIRDRALKEILRHGEQGVFRSEKIIESL